MSRGRFRHARGPSTAVAIQKHESRSYAQDDKAAIEATDACGAFRVSRVCSSWYWVWVAALLPELRS